MAYTPTAWETGDVVTAAKLNKIEGGVDTANNPFIVTLTPTSEDFSGTMDKTIAEIVAAYEAGKQIVFELVAGPGIYYSSVCTNVNRNGSLNPAFGTSIVVRTDDWFLINISTQYAADDSTNYYTAIFPLTPFGS